MTISKPYLAEVVDLPAGCKYPLKSGDTVLVLNEIAQMPGHAVIALKNGKVLFGYHTDNFRRLTRKEL